MRDQLVTVATFNYAEEAYLSKAKLESEGIVCFVADEVSERNFGSAGIGGVRLQVKESDAAEAIRILEVQK